MQVEVTEEEHQRYQCIVQESSQLLAQLNASLESYRAEAKSVRSHVTAHSRKSHSRRSRSSRSSHRSDKLAEAEIELASALIAKQKHKSKLKLQMLMEEVETDAAIAIAEKKVEILTKHNNSQDLSSDEDFATGDASPIPVPRNSATGYRASSDPVDADSVSRKLETIQAQRTHHVELSAPIPLNLKESDECWETPNAKISDHAAAAPAITHLAQTTTLTSEFESQSHVATVTRDTPLRPVSHTHTLGFSDHDTAPAQAATLAPSLSTDFTTNHGFSLFSRDIAAASPRLPLQSMNVGFNAVRAAPPLKQPLYSQTLSSSPATRAALTSPGCAPLRTQQPVCTSHRANIRPPISSITAQQLASALASTCSPRITAPTVLHPTVPRSTASSWTASLRAPPISRIATVASGVDRLKASNFTQPTRMPLTRLTNALVTSAPPSHATAATLAHTVTAHNQTALARTPHAVTPLAPVAPAFSLHATPAITHAMPATSVHGVSSLAQAAFHTNRAASTLAPASPATSVQGASSLATAIASLAPHAVTAVTHAAATSLAYAVPAFSRPAAVTGTSMPVFSHFQSAFAHEPATALGTSTLPSSLPTSSNALNTVIPTATSLAFADETLPLPRSWEHHTREQAHVVNTAQPVSQHYSAPEALAPRSQPPPTEAGFLAEYLGQLSLALMSQINLSRAPYAEPAVFTGENPLDFPEWLSSFESLIKTRGIPANEHMRYLQKYTDGPAKEAIKGFFWLPPAQAFESSFAILKERYNDPFYLACTYRETLASWPKVGNSDSAALRRFVDFLKQLATAKFIISDLSILDDEVENRKIGEKLPDWLRLRWNRISHRAKKTYGTFPSFVDFVAFLVEEDGIANAPLARRSVEGLDKPKADHSQPKSKGRSLATKQKPQSSTATQAQQPIATPVGSAEQSQVIQSVSVPAISLSTSTHSTNAAKKPDTAKPDKKSPHCYFCKEDHYISQCESLIAAPLDKRKDFLKTHQRCHSCLSIKHKAKDCRYPHTCTHCKEKHHPAFHALLPTDSACTTD